MKKIILLTALLISLNINALTLTRPTREYLIIFDDNQTAIFEADDIAEALQAFNKEYPNRRIYSAAQRSYVQSIWIWVK